MSHLRISEVAALLRVSDDTIRRWVDQGVLAMEQRPGARATIDSAQVATFIVDRRAEATSGSAGSSARNRFDGVVTAVQREGLMAQVEIQAGPFRVVSLMTREAADEMGLEFGSLATAVVKATNVIVESPVRDTAP
jgi:molybdopterin-binding protein